MSLSNLTAQLTSSVASQGASASASRFAQSLRTRATDATCAVRGAISNTTERLGLLRRDSQDATVSFPSDGSVCERCGTVFSLMKRRTSCAACDKYLCPACFGGTLPTGLAFLCLCRQVCTQCTSLNSRELNFRSTQQELETGTSCIILHNAATSLFSDTNTRISAWLSLDSQQRYFVLQSLEQSRGVPIYQETCLLRDIVYIRDFGLGIEIRDKDKGLKIELEHAADWARNMNEAVEVQTTTEEKLSVVSAKNEIRLLEMEERRKINEERKKQLTDGGRLGMRFAAEAMAK